tara:strand:+ start:160 stop:492 length:333 start_codon:yes stop_codon:yes gene_type:complete
MEKKILFTVENWKGDIVDIYGPTKEKLHSGKVIKVQSSLEHDMMHERRTLLSLAKTDREVKEIMRDTNWKIRVLNEQRLNEETNTLRRSQRIKDQTTRKKRFPRSVKFVE